LPEAVEADASGNVVDKHDADIPQFALESLESDKITTKELVVTDGFEDGKTWENKTGERASGVEYFNDTGKPIEVSIRLSATGTTINHLLLVDEITVDQCLISVTGNYTVSLQGYIPNNSVYSLTIAAGGSIQNWFELR
ncbi:MAG: hypothetical protein R3203_10170, partial [Pseudoalteromonas tetraodonis]|nr:hypothetical protein [Pseudoalteromonas tetraodonis]